MSIIVAVVAFCFWFVPESPRYLFVTKQYKELHKVFRRIAKSNNKVYDPSVLENVDSEDNAVSKLLNEETNNEMAPTKMKENVMLKIVTNKKFIMMFISSIVNWITCAFVYSGISFNLDVLGGNPYLNFTYSIMAEILATAACQFTQERFGRKMPYFFNMLIIFISFTCIGFVPANMKWLTIICFFLGKFSISFTYNAIMIITAETYPTVIRNTSLSICSVFSKFGAILSPYVQLLGGNYWKPLPYLIYAGFALVSAILCLFFTPETKGKPLLETLEDMLDKNDNSSNIAKKTCKANEI